jgi:nitrite reductase (NO-forming)
VDNPLLVLILVAAIGYAVGQIKIGSTIIVGTIFDTVIKEGVALTRENSGHYGAQAVDLAPAQGTIIEFTTAEDGMYPVVTHAFNFVGRGALGLIQAGDGDPKK